MHAHTPSSPHFQFIVVLVILYAVSKPHSKTHTHNKKINKKEQVVKERASYGTRQYTGRRGQLRQIEGRKKTDKKDR
jgi:uncharacterized membrane protein